MNKHTKGMMRIFGNAPKKCGGKISYDKKGATTAKNFRFMRDHVELRMYQHFDHWHLTKQLETL